MVGAMSVLQVLRSPLWEQPVDARLLAMQAARCIRQSALTFIASKLGSYKLQVRFGDQFVLRGEAPCVGCENELGRFLGDHQGR